MAGRVATWLAVGAMAVVVGVALVDGVRGGGQEEPRVTRTVTASPGVESRAAIADRVRREGIRGRLFYTDANCTLHAVSFPELEPAATPGVRGLGCAFSASPDGERIATPGAAWSPDSRRVAVCRDATVVVSVATERAPEVSRHEGCAPAWRPDGTLTLVRDGEVVDAAGTRILSRRALTAAARKHPFAPDVVPFRVTYDLVDLAWLTQRRVAVLLAISFSAGGRDLEPQTQVVLLQDGSVVGSETAVGHQWTRLSASRGGGFVEVRPGWLLDGRARRVYPLLGTGTGGADALAVSPDGRWLAAGLRGRVALLSIPALQAGRFRSVSLPFPARDLAWR